MGPDVTLASCWPRRILAASPEWRRQSRREAQGGRRPTDSMLKAFCASLRLRSPEIARSAAWSGRRGGGRETNSSRAGISRSGAGPHRELDRRFARDPGRTEKTVSLRTWAADLDVLRTGHGRPLPPHLKAELDRLCRRLLMTLEMIREVEAAREQAMEAHDSPANRTVKALCRLRGLGDNFSAVLAKEVFYRTFDNR